jgi:hypothetical protein
MKINYSDKPFEFLVIDNFLDSKQEKGVMNEVNFILDNDILNKSPSKAVDGSAEDPFTKEVLVKRHSIFLHNFLVRHRSTSKIYQAIKDNFLMSDLPINYPNSILLKYVPITNHDATLLSFYKDGDYYKSHNDYSVLTGILYLIMDKDFEGGDLYFPEFDFKHTALNNQFIAFPSCVMHEVTKLHSLKKNDDSYKRLAITTLITIDSKNAN